MPQPRTMYIERKTRNGVNLGDKGPAVIGEVTFSKTGRTVYYKGMAFKRPSSNEQSCIQGNYYLYDPTEETDPYPDEFWITGVKKRGSNRYPWATGQPVVENGSLE